MVAVASEFTQQIVQALLSRHKHGRPDQRADVEIWGPLQLEQVLAIRMPMMFSRSPGTPESASGPVSITERSSAWGVSSMSIMSMRGRCHHDIASGHVGHANHALDHHARVSADHLVVFGFRQGFDEFFCAESGPG